MTTPTHSPADGLSSRRGRVTLRTKRLIQNYVPYKLYGFASILRRSRPIAQRECNICGYVGWFRDFGRPVRIDALCPQCGSLERHRLFMLWWESEGSTTPLPIVHFAPEQVIESMLRGQHPAGYSTGDLFAPNVDQRLDLEALDLKDASVGTVICNHVLEHVRDGVALAEIRRVLAPGGRLICSVPIVEGWDSTYENEGVRSSSERWLHFGQGDHVRYYGRDFRSRVLASGLTGVEEYAAEGQAVIAFGLQRGERVFVYERPAGTPVDLPLAV